MSAGNGRHNDLRPPFGHPHTPPAPPAASENRLTEQRRPHPGPLTDLQRARIDYARRDLEYARAEDLAQLEAAGLILIIERLRGRLDDVLQLIEELASNGELQP
ncbi:hypothetical protein [Streptomyces flaveolus]|uniref:hypothetical protein n=1 Tax=Streptomyces flaveolus TaxID=67297 RepID=UPI0033F2327E